MPDGWNVVSETAPGGDSDPWSVVSNAPRGNGGSSATPGASATPLAPKPGSAPAATASDPWAVASEKPALSQSTGLFDKTKDLALAANRKIADTLAPLRKGSDTLPPVADTAPARTDPHPPVEDIDQQDVFEALKKRGADLKAKGIDPKTDPEYRELARKQAKGISQNLESAAQLGAPLGVIGKGIAGLAEKGATRIGERVAAKAPDAAAAPAEGALTKPPALEQPRSFEDQLFQLESQKTADKLDVMKRLKAVPKGVDPAVWEKLYHYEEDPKGVTLTADEQALYDKHVAPLKAEADQLSAELERLGYPTERAEATEGFPKEGASEGYTPRYVKGRTRSFGEVLEQWKQGIQAKFGGGAAGRSMRKTVDAQRSRRFWNAVNPETGEKTVVHVGTDGRVLAFDGTPDAKEFGTFGKGQKIGAGSKIRVDKQTWRLEPATTKEIEAVAQTRYSKNVLANRLDNVAKLRSAVRNARFIEEMKASPEWDKVAVKVTDSAVPPTTNGKQWRVPAGPLQFRGYYMEPALADALEDFAKASGQDSMWQGLEKISSVVKGSIFWWPFPHMLNTLDHFVVSGGLAGNVRGLVTGSLPRAMTRAIRAVATQNEDYMRLVRAGTSLPYARTLTEDLHKALVAKLGEDVKLNPGRWGQLARIFGYDNPVRMLGGIYDAGAAWMRGANRALWFSTDVMNIARIFEEMERGRPLEQAIKHVEEHMPNYRIHGQVAGSRIVSRLLQNPISTMFGRYQYNRLASYGHMVRALVSRLPAKEKAEALDKMAMLGVMVILGYPAVDAIVRKATGNPNASVRRFGASAVPQAAIDVATGAKSPSEALPSIFTPGPLFEAAPELLHGRYGYSGQPIARIDDLKRGDTQFLHDLFTWIGSKIEPIGRASAIEEGRRSTSQQLLDLFGIKSPTDEQVQAKERYRQRDAVEAERRAKRLELRRENAE